MHGHILEDIEGVARERYGERTGYIGFRDQSSLVVFNKMPVPPGRPEAIFPLKVLITRRQIARTLQPKKFRATKNPRMAEQIYSVFMDGQRNQTRYSKRNGSGIPKKVTGGVA